MVVHAQREERFDLAGAHVADLAADHCAVRRGQRGQLQRGQAALQQVEHDPARGAAAAQQRVELVKRLHQQVPHLRAVLRLAHEPGVRQGQAHRVERVKGVHRVQQIENRRDRPVRVLRLLQRPLQSQERRDRLLPAGVEPRKRLLPTVLDVGKRLFDRLAAHVHALNVGAQLVRVFLRETDEAGLHAFHHVRCPPSAGNDRQARHHKPAQRVRARRPLFRDVGVHAVLGQDRRQKRRIAAFTGIDHSHLRRVLPRRHHAAHPAGCKVHLREHGADRVQRKMFGRLLHGGRAQRVERALEHLQILGRVERLHNALPLDGHTGFLRQHAQPFEREVHRREKTPVRRAVVIRLHGQRERIRQRGHMNQMICKRWRDHVKAVDENILPAQHAGAWQARKHLAGDVLRIAELAEHFFLVCCVDARGIGKLSGGRHCALRLVHRF